jgi:ubiquinone/menaquinone biosynthesis C-methylase UbiE
MIPDKIKAHVKDTYGRLYSSLSGVSADKITEDVLSFKKPVEQIVLIERFAGTLRGKKLLEIGSGFGIFTIVATRDYGIDAFGVEPSGEGFEGSFALSQQILAHEGVDTGRIREGVGEAIPFPDNSFDCIYSTNVLEHVHDPKKVIAEAIRVCKPGGYIQIVVPNYGSFYDGHYGCLYLPYQPKWLWKFTVRFLLRRDPSYVDTLRTDINYYSMMRWISPHLAQGVEGKQGKVKLLSAGEEVFRERMESVSFSAWATLERVRVLVKLVHTLRLVKLAIWSLLLIKAQTPLIITLKKQQ